MVEFDWSIGSYDQSKRSNSSDHLRILIPEYRTLIYFSEVLHAITVHLGNTKFYATFSGDFSFTSTSIIACEKLSRRVKICIKVFLSCESWKYVSAKLPTLLCSLLLLCWFMNFHFSYGWGHIIKLLLGLKQWQKS